MILLRGIRILLVFISRRLDLLLPESPDYPWYLRLVLGTLRLLPEPSAPPGVRFRTALEDLGPIFVKFGQILSTRRDLFDDGISLELQKLQDRVPPFPSDTARAIVVRSLGRDLGELFSEFDDEPLASASVAQIHTARLPDDREAIVKIVRPGIQTLIGRDIALMFRIAELLETYWADGRRLHLRDIVGDYDHTIHDELDLRLEASNTSRLRSNWAQSDRLLVPEVYWDHCSRDVMVMERMHGIGLADLDRIRAQGTDMKRLAHLGVEIFFTQVFDHNFFHADMHPGNIMIVTDDPGNPLYIALDCAIIGSLTERDQDYLARNLLAFFKRDYREVARLHIDSGWVPADTDPLAFETVIRSVCEPVFEKPIAEISFGNFLLSLFQTARKFNMEVQPQLILLQKTLLYVEGLGRQIYPQLDLWSTALPFIETWVARRYGFRHALDRLIDEGPGLLAQAPDLPGLTLNALRQMSRLDEHQQAQARGISRIEDQLAEDRRQRRRMRYALILLALAGLLNWSGFGWLEDLSALGWILGASGIYMLLCA